MVKLKLYGNLDDPDFYDTRDFLRRSVVEYDWGHTEDGPPTIQFPNGEIIVNPTVEDVAKRLGWITQPKYDEYDVSIYGAGPAGLSAAVYAASEGLKTVLVEREAIGGQAGTSSLIENYMGFPQGITGAELAERARQQALKFGVEILLLREGIKGSFKDNRIYVELAGGTQLVAKSNICATGIEYERLGLENEQAFFHRGIYYGAGSTEACFCKGKDIFVVGGGNSAGQAVSYFSQFARKVYMVIRKGNLAESMSDYLLQRLTRIPNVEILYWSRVTEVEGNHELKRIKIATQDQPDRWYDTTKLFICIGGNPNTEWAAENGILRDPKGYLITGTDLLTCDGFTACWELKRPPYHLETSMPGSFAAGDVRYGSVKRVASAVGEGAMAVTMVHKYLSEI